MRDTRKLERELARVKAASDGGDGEAETEAGRGAGGGRRGVSERRAHRLALERCKSLGFGFAQFSSHEHALAALNALNNRPDVFPNHQVLIYCICIYTPYIIKLCALSFYLSTDCHSRLLF